MVGTMAFGLGINKAAVRGGDSSLARRVSSSITRKRAERPRCAACRLLLVLAKKRYGLTRVFYRQDRRPFREERAWQRYHEVERFVQSTEVPATPRLPPLRRSSQVGKPAATAMFARRCQTGWKTGLAIATKKARRDPQAAVDSLYGTAGRGTSCMATVTASGDIELKE